jgi:hypothetical protein
MKTILSLAVLGLFITMGSAQTFTDPLTSPNENWTYNSLNLGNGPTFSGAGMSISETSSGQETFNVLNMPSNDGTVPTNFSGDFSLQIGFTGLSSDAMIALGISDGDEIDYSSADGVHSETFYNPPGSPGSLGTDYGTSGILDISRTGDTLTAGINGDPLFTITDTSTVSSIYFALHTTTASTASVTFNNFALNIVTAPEPGTVALAGLTAGLALIGFRRRFAKPKSV